MNLLLLLCAFTALTDAPCARTHACAHRGDQACAPENTLAAFRLAVEKGAPMIEFDAQATRDGHLVIMHDPQVDRTTDGTGAVSDLTFEAIRALDAGGWFRPEFKGERVPTLGETLDVIPETILCNVHLKDSPGVAAATAQVLLDRKRLGHCFLACTMKQAEEAHSVAPEARICNMDRQDNNRGPYVEQTIMLKSAFIQLHKKQGLDGLKEDVARLHAGGVRVNFFGAQEEGLIRTLADADVDYILTDDLDLCMRVLRDYPR